MKDVLGYMMEKGAGKQVRWEFVGEIDRSDLAKIALEKIEGDERLKAYVLKSLGERDFNIVRNSLVESLGTILGGLK